ncbi:hypothetical protein D9619_000056 [Psilocybe cf. subviscida]|uniref:SWIM-type domain-containing protein n=1 Tax=Psilocybe cf. subviscida TaxID=2480587 RepID=A0A8H5BED6_9AGAR|nr:hypothetical protein D9619_000056 [Psilocybe cf. subviscida]
MFSSVSHFVYDMASDDLEEINGIKPNVWLHDGEERDMNSLTSTSVYKVKRTMDHYYCTCPAWRNQGGCPVNARTCKHLKSLLGEKYELARIKMRNPNGPQPGSSKSTKGKSTSKATSSRSAGMTPKTPAKSSRAPARTPATPTPTASSSKGKKRDAPEEDDNDQDEEDAPPPAKRGRTAGSRSPTTRRSEKAKDVVNEDDALPEENDGDPDDQTAAAALKSVPELLLANKWDIEKGPDPTGWWLSEKLDGVRTYYDGSQFVSRLGNAFTPPNWFLDKLPKDVTLDGELYGGRGNFQSTVSIVKTVNSVHWSNITFQIFDVPSRGYEPFEKRYEYLQRTFGTGAPADETDPQICVVEHQLVRDRQHVLDELQRIESLGGEGLMLRRPLSLYEGRRSGSLLKIKTFYDAEAIVIGYAEGKGRNKGITGALRCKMESGKTFNVGSGLTDSLRHKPPQIGSIITYRFQELTRDGVPRFPSYIGVAIDKDEPKDAEIPEHRKAGAGAADA